MSLLKDRDRTWSRKYGIIPHGPSNFGFEPLTYQSQVKGDTHCATGRDSRSVPKLANSQLKTRPQTVTAPILLIWELWSSRMVHDRAYPCQTYFHAWSTCNSHNYVKKPSMMHYWIYCYISYDIIWQCFLFYLYSILSVNLSLSVPL